MTGQNCTIPLVPLVPPIPLAPLGTGGGGVIPFWMASGTSGTRGHAHGRPNDQPDQNDTAFPPLQCRPKTTKDLAVLPPVWTQTKISKTYGVILLGEPRLK